MLNSENKKRKIGILLTDGVGIRNFLLGGLTDYIIEQGNEVVIFHFLDKSESESLLNIIPKVSWIKLPKYKENVVMHFLRLVMEFTHMRTIKTFSASYNLKRPILGNSITKFKYQTARSISYITYLLSLNGFLRSINLWFSFNMNYPNIYKTILNEVRIDILFISNQKAAISAPLVIHANKYNIPTAAFIFSWDNLTTKGNFLAPFKNYFVWGNIMKTELMNYYPLIPSHRIFTVGTPQFSNHKNSEILMNRNLFFNTYKLDTNKKIVLYTGGTPDTVPQDPSYLLHIAKILSTEQDKYQIVLRPSPTDDGLRFKKVIDQFPNITLIEPKWSSAHNRAWHTVMPTNEDAQLLTNLLNYSDIVINVASTITIDALILNKPVINIAFDFYPFPLGRPIKDIYYKFEHYLEVLKMNVTTVVYDPNLLKEVILSIEKTSIEKKELINQFLDKEIGVPISKSNKKIYEYLQSIN